MRSRVKVAVVVGLLAVVAGAWAPARAAHPGDNGRVVFVKWGQGIVTANVDGTDAFTVRPDPDGPVGAGLYAPRFSPDGTKIAYYHGAWPEYSVSIVDADGTTDTVVATGATFPDWSPDGRLVVQGPSAIEIVDVDTGTRTAIPGSEGVTEPRWSPDGALIAGVGGPDLIVFRPDGSDRRAIASDENPDDSWGFSGLADWSPDSTRVLFLEGGNACTIHIRIADVAAGQDHALHRGDGGFGNGCNEDSATWSPDGTRILYVTGPSFETATGHPPNGGLFSVRPDGSDLRLETDDYGAGYHWGVAAGMRLPTDPLLCPILGEPLRTLPVRLPLCR